MESDPSKRTMAGALQAFVGQYQTDVVLFNADVCQIRAPLSMLTLPSEAKMLLCSRADDDHNADSRQVPPESTVWYICR